MTKATGTPLDFVFTGKRWGGIKKTHSPSLRWIETDGSLGDEQLYVADKHWKSLAVGHIYRGAARTENGITNRGDVRIVGPWPNQEDRMEWQAKDDFAEDQARVVSMEKDARSINEIEQLLVPLRQRRHALLKRHDMSGVYALDAAVTRALHKPLKKEEWE